MPSLDVRNDTYPYVKSISLVTVVCAKYWKFLYFLGVLCDFELIAFCVFAWHVAVPLKNTDLICSVFVFLIKCEFVWWKHLLFKHEYSKNYIVVLYIYFFRHRYRHAEWLNRYFEVQLSSDVADVWCADEPELASYRVIQICLWCTELCPFCVAYYGNRSAAYMMLSKYDRALDDARRSTLFDPTFVKVPVSIFCHMSSVYEWAIYYKGLFI